MELILLRHAQAEKPNPERYPDDDQRPLTETGIKRQRKVATALYAMGLRPNRIITSPRLRARQTAEITAVALGREGVLERSDALGEGYSPSAVLDMLGTCTPREVVMLVGHEPDLGVMAGLFLGPNAGPVLKFRKSAVLGLYFPRTPQPGEGTLEFFYQPNHLLSLR
ncbi:phosphohistidine phosphatase [Gammaproteobacteria bacterium]